VARPRPKARAASGSGALLVPLPPNRTNRHAAPAQYVRIDHTVYQPANCASVILAATGSRVKVKLRSNSTRRKTGPRVAGRIPLIYTDSGRTDERTRTSFLIITSALSYVCRCFSEFQDPHTEGKLANMGVPCISRRSLRLPSRLLSRHEDVDVEPNLTAFSLQVTIGVP
jgi:hypothetical protein